MLSVRSDRPVDPLTLAVMREVDNVVNEMGLPYFVCGAMARDIMLTHVYNVETGIATVDVDFGVVVESWKMFENVKARLVATGKFEAADKMAPRLNYRATAKSKGYPLDIIPFGGVEQPPNTITWPPDRNEVMNVIGYEEALATAVEVDVEDGFCVPVISLPGLAILKLFAWVDRGAQNPKDARDLLLLFRQYAYAGNQDRLYGEAIDILEVVDYDVDLAGPRLLGRDVRAIAATATHAKIIKLLADGKKTDKLVTHMAAALRGIEDQIEIVERLLDQFKAGLTQE